MSESSPPPSRSVPASEHSTQISVQCICPVHGNVRYHPNSWNDHNSSSSRNPPGHDPEVEIGNSSFTSIITVEDQLDLDDPQVFDRLLQSFHQNDLVSPDLQVAVTSLQSLPNLVPHAHQQIDANAVVGFEAAPFQDFESSQVSPTNSAYDESRPTTRSGPSAEATSSPRSPPQPRKCRACGSGTNEGAAGLSNARQKRPLPRLTRSKTRPHEDKRRYSCTETGCPKDLSRTADLRRHLSSVHKMSDRYYQCDESGCQSRTWRRDKIKDHCRKVHKHGRGEEMFSEHLKHPAHG